MRTPTVLFALLALAALTPAARAQRLIFQQGDTLFVANDDGKEARRLFIIGLRPDVLWAASPDGRRVAWMTRAGSKGDGSAKSLSARPVVVRISDTLTGQHQKRLFATDALKDRQGRRVTTLGTEPAGSFDAWQPVSLSWSADSRTLYLSCTSLVNDRARATFAVDAAAGTALIDAEGHWKPIAPITDVEARGGLLVGIGADTYAPEGKGAEIEYHPLVAVNLIEGTRYPLYDPPKGLAALPDYAFATGSPALAPENRAIAFIGNEKGVWLTDKFGKAFRRLVEGAVFRPCWSPDGKLLYVLLPRPLTGDRTIYDLYTIVPPADAEDALPPAPTLILQNIDWFDVVPD
jgi:hypothetical protein